MSDKPFALSVKVVIRNATGHCLLIRRSSSSKGSPGKWDLPGGKAELGEKFDEALLREVAEETGLSIHLTHVAGSAECELPDKKVAYIIMEASLASGEVHLSSEHDDFAWVTLEEFPTKELVEQFIPFAKAYQRAEERQHSQRQSGS